MNEFLHAANHHLANLSHDIRQTQGAILETLKRIETALSWIASSYVSVTGNPPLPASIAEAIRPAPPQSVAN